MVIKYENAKIMIKNELNKGISYSSLIFCLAKIFKKSASQAIRLKESKKHNSFIEFLICFFSSADQKSISTQSFITLVGSKCSLLNLEPSRLKTEN